jgi:hypothetical protein
MVPSATGLSKALRDAGSVSVVLRAAEKRGCVQRVPSDRGGSQPSYAGWPVIVGVVLLEYALFRQFALREVVGAYPMGFDPSVYLTVSYQTYEDVLQRGFLRGILVGLLRPVHSGVLLHVQGSVLFLLLGPSRLSALTLNFLYFALYECVLAWTLLWLTRRWSVALASVGLLASLHTPFYVAGGLLDFRPDFGAFCLFGIFLCLAVRSGIFLERRWALVAGVAAALLVLFRFVASVYMAGILGVVFLGSGLNFLRSRQDGERRGLAVRRLIGVAMAGAVVIVIASPALWHQRMLIKHVYVMTHLRGEEIPIRARQIGIDGTIDALLLYPRALLVDHLGWVFLALGLGMVGAGWLLVRDQRVAAPDDASEWTTLPLGAGTAFAAISFAVTLVVLILDPIKWPHIASTLVPPAIWLVLLGMLAVTGAHRRDRGSRRMGYGLACLSAVAVIGGMVFQLEMFSRPGPMSRWRADVQQIAEAHNLIEEHSRRSGLKRVRIFADHVSDYLIAQAVTVAVYERHGSLMQAETSAPLGISAIGEREAVEALRSSDFVFLTTSRPAAGFQFPVDVSLERLAPALRSVCDQEFVPLREFRIFGRVLMAYARPPRRGQAVRIEGSGTVQRGELGDSADGRV